MGYYDADCSYSWLARDVIKIQKFKLYILIDYEQFLFPSLARRARNEKHRGAENGRAKLRDERARYLHEMGYQFYNLSQKVSSLKSKCASQFVMLFRISRGNKQNWTSWKLFLHYRCLQADLM